MLEQIKALGLKLQSISNTGEVMVLLNGVKKATGPTTERRELGVAPENAVGIVFCNAVPSAGISALVISSTGLPIARLSTERPPPDPRVSGSIPGCSGMTRPGNSTETTS